MKSTEIQPNEYAPFYSNYINVVGDVDLFEILETSAGNFIETLKSVPEDKFEYRYAEGKWTIKDLVQHCLRAFFYCNFQLPEEGEKKNVAGSDCT